ncbi:ribokinase [Pseudomonas duriflava]|uniref:Ribokinase n=1 Tax=Pseudomonas duriflava TaxID=459528 RepID=A0A562Q711_9PSED|nr:ribokinase [Pseudomonas duriflava]TWI52527.1 ribokinase [Pseudomonas duriflava]
MQAKIVVVGSLNMDLVVRTPRLPVGGETLAGHSFVTAPGGKGANQAVACARLGAQVSMIGCIGHDAYGEELRSGLEAEGIECSAVESMPGVPTGTASILVDDKGQNCIVIVAGGNGELSPEHLTRYDATLQAADVVIAQLEVPVATVEKTLTRAHELGKTVILNPAPAVGPLPAQWYGYVDYLVPNESEASLLTGIEVNSQETAAQAAQKLLDAGTKRVLLTMGSQGVFYKDTERQQHFPAQVVQAVDTTAAGDTFVGGFATALGEGLPLEEAVRLGQQAAALSVTRAGAQPSIPYRRELKF